MSLLTVAEARAQINTGLSDAELQAVIDRIEAEIEARVGPNQDDTGNVTHEVTRRGGSECLFMPSEISSVSSIVEDETTLDSDEYQTWPAGVIERLPVNLGIWGDRCVVTYKPADDREIRKSATIDLLRLDLNRTGMKSESIGGEYSYTAEEWNQQRREIMRRIGFISV